MIDAHCPWRVRNPVAKLGMPTGFFVTHPLTGERIGQIVNPVNGARPAQLSDWILPQPSRVYFPWRSGRLLLSHNKPLRSGYLTQAGFGREQAKSLGPL
jgi:hypothetical protein